MSQESSSRPSSPYMPVGGPTGGTVQGVADQARDTAGQVVDQAKDTAGQVADQAKQQYTAVIGKYQDSPEAKLAKDREWRQHGHDSHEPHRA